MVYVQRYSLYARQDSILAEELEWWKLNITVAEKAKKYGEVWRMHSYFLISMFFSAVCHNSADVGYS